jgi:hypothetical protein
MSNGEAIVVERVANGFILSPKDVNDLTKLRDIFVFSNIADLEQFLEKHFAEREEGA